MALRTITTDMASNTLFVVLPRDFLVAIHGIIQCYCCINIVFLRISHYCAKSDSKLPWERGCPLPSSQATWFSRAVKRRHRSTTAEDSHVKRTGIVIVSSVIVGNHVPTVFLLPSKRTHKQNWLKASPSHPPPLPSPNRELCTVWFIILKMTARAQINNIPSKCHFIPLFLFFSFQNKDRTLCKMHVIRISL